jgi:hypothetical protein
MVSSGIEQNLINESMKLYFDIDGVLIAQGRKPANYVTEFLKIATEKHDCYWLTTHCKENAEITIAMEHIKDVLPAEAISYCKLIKPTQWSHKKTEAIDLNSDFLWFDDVSFDFDNEVLAQHNKSGSFILVDLINNPDQLRELLRLL